MKARSGPPLFVVGGVEWIVYQNREEQTVEVKICKDWILNKRDSCQSGRFQNRGTPKSSILIGFSIINHPFWGTSIFGKTHIVNNLIYIFRVLFRQSLVVKLCGLLV